MLQKDEDLELRDAIRGLRVGSGMLPDEDQGVS